MQGGKNILLYTVRLLLKQPSLDNKGLALMHKMQKTEHATLQRKYYYELSSKYEHRVLRIEHVLARDTNFKFYTGLYRFSKLCNI
jgi:hypothetical protein